MNRYTDQEFKIANQIFAFKLRKLYRDNFDLFEQLQEYVPHPIYINERDTFDYNYFSKQLINKGKEIEDLLNHGRSYLRKISCPISLKNAEFKSKSFHETNDFDGVCSYTQQIQLNGEMTYIFTNKLLLDEAKTISICYFLEDLGPIGRILRQLAPRVYASQRNYQLFQSLTKQEKIVIKLLSEGLTNREIGERLYISYHTVHAHRKNIYHKLGIKSISQLIRFSLVLDMF